MKKIRYMFASIFLLGLLISIPLKGLAVNAAESDNLINGKCGERVYYELNKATGVLRIYGNGPMEDYWLKSDFDSDQMDKDTYLNGKKAPWFEQGNESYITKVIIEEGVTSIGSSSFFMRSYKGSGSFSCENINSVEIAESVTEIGSYAFCGCKNLNSIEIPNKVITIGSHAFGGCHLNSIQWGASLQNIGKEAFTLEDFVELKFPEQLRYIGFDAFGGCEYLKSVVVNDGCEIYSEVFLQCNSLESVIIGKNCRIHGKAFYDCQGITNVSIGDGSVGVGRSGYTDGEGIFKNCTNLQTITLPDSWQIGLLPDNNPAYSLQFSNCSNLRQIILSDTNSKYQVINNVVFSKDGTTIVYYPSGLTETEYTIPYNVSVIDSRAFSQAKFERVIIPRGVSKIGNGAFSDCKKLNNVIIPNGVEKLGANVFESCDNLKVIVLPESVKSIDVNGKASTATFDESKLEVVYAESGSFAAHWAGGKFRQTVYCTLDMNFEGGVSMKIPIIPGDKYGELPIASRGGYSFVGWYTSKTDGNRVLSNTLVETKESQILYAHWDPLNPINDYSIGYDANGGMGAPSEQKYTGTRKVNLSSKEPYRTGYIFQGWSTSRNAASAMYQPGDSITLDRDLTLYAVWKADDSNSNIDLPDPKEDVPSQQIITADSQVIDKGTKPFYITAETSGDGKLTYKSGNTKVISISSTGKVVVRGYGKAVVTIRASQTAQYEATLKEITITVVPKKVGIVKATSSKRKTLYVLWKKDMTVDGYQVNFSTRKDFKSNTYKREYSKSSTHMRTIGLKSNQTYYVRIRSYVKVGGKKYYGAWSTVKRVKIK